MMKRSSGSEVASLVERSGPKEYAASMRKPTVIYAPFPTLEEVARIYGISPARRKRIERDVQEFLTRNGAANKRTQRRAGAARRSKTK
jgi:hypothetical protein